MHFRWNSDTLFGAQPGCSLSCLMVTVLLKAVAESKPNGCRAAGREGGGAPVPGGLCHLPLRRAALDLRRALPLHACQAASHAAPKPRRAAEPAA